MKGIRVRYQGCKTIAEIISPSGAIKAVGIAFWNPEDSYDKKLGKQIAVGRARKQLMQTEARTVVESLVADGHLTVVREPEIDSRLLVEAVRCASQEGLCFIHPRGDKRAEFVVMTEKRYGELTARIFGEEGIPVTDPEWRHSHVEPDMLDAGPFNT